MDLKPPSLTLSQPLPLGQSAASADDLRAAGQGFEAMFLSMLLKSARAGLPGDDLTGSAAVRSSMEMLDAQLAQSGASRANLGIADAVMRQFAPNGAKP